MCVLKDAWDMSIRLWGGPPKRMALSPGDYQRYDDLLIHWGVPCERPCKGLTYRGLKIKVTT